MDRRDLAASLGPLVRALLAAEREEAAAHGLSMWGYAALHRLADAPVRGQVVLAAELGLDKTRLIPVLDELQEHGYIRREPDPDDRRARVLSLTPAGRRVFQRTQKRVHRREDELLAPLDERERAAFVRALTVLGEAAASH
jgi:DNA-binding MarR family transcriptional regulator